MDENIKDLPLYKPRTTEQLEDEALNNFITELSVEMEESEKKRKSMVPEHASLEQTIIIGEMDEGNIFDDIKDIRTAEAVKDENTIEISKDELKSLIDNLKTRYTAEIDAILLEQASYKRIVFQMVQRFKHQ